MFCSVENVLIFVSHMTEATQIQLSYLAKTLIVGAGGKFVQKLADEIGVTPRTFYRYMKDNAMVMTSAPILNIIAEEWLVSIDLLLTRKKPTNADINNSDQSHARD